MVILMINNHHHPAHPLTSIRPVGGQHRTLSTGHDGHRHTGVGHHSFLDVTHPGPRSDPEAILIGHNKLQLNSYNYTLCENNHTHTHTWGWINTCVDGSLPGMNIYLHLCHRFWYHHATRLVTPCPIQASSTRKNESNIRPKMSM